MLNRETALASLLNSAGWSNAERGPLAGDASSRSYERLTRKGSGAVCILMNAPPESCGPVDPFLAVTGFLRGRGYSAPAIIAADRVAGYLLLEDLGDALYAHILADRPQEECKLYDAAIDLLAELRETPAPDCFPLYSPTEQADLAALALDWYRRFSVPEPVPADVADRFLATVRDLIAGLGGPAVFLHRDYHAENLIWLPERQGMRRVGLIDFQDAALGHPAYDLVSILEDARRDVPHAVRKRAIRRYCMKAGTDEADLLRHLAISGAQRNLRIVGVFARLAVRDGKLGYLNLIPRVWGHLKRDLSHPALAALAELVDRWLPPPTGAVLQRLREHSP